MMVKFNKSLELVAGNRTTSLMMAMIKKYPRAVNGITMTTAKYVLERMYETGQSPEDICEEEDLWQLT